MKKIFEDENIVVTDTEGSGLIIRHKKSQMQVSVTSDADSIRASSSWNRRKIEARPIESYLEVRKS